MPLSRSGAPATITRAGPGSARSDLGALVQADAFRQQPRAHHRAQLRVVLGQDRALVDDRDLGAQATERLRQLAADRPAAQHQKPLRQLGQVEHGLVGQVAR